MLVRSFLGAAALAATTGIALAQPTTLPNGYRPTSPYAATVIPAVVSEPAEQPKTGRVRLATLLKPMADDKPAPAPAPVSVNPAAPPGFNGACPTYKYEDDSIGAPGRFWARGEWLYWATRGQPIPALATGSPAGTARNLAGVLGSPNTVVNYGDGNTNTDFRNGYRLNAGWWFDDCRECGIEGDFFFLGDSRQGYSAASDGSTIIARPFVNAATGLQDSQLVSFPGTVGGSLTVDARTSALGAGANLVKNICGTPCARLDFLVGYRYWNVADDLTITENLTALAGQNNVPAGTTYQITDRFRTSNNFHGGLVGLSGEKNFGRWFVGARASVALGVNCQTVEIDGSTVLTPPGGAPTTYAGGLLAQPTNIGSHTRNAFTVVPELGLRIGANVTENVRVYAGYNFLYMSDVLRAGDQIDPFVNTSQLPPRTNVTGPARPAFTPVNTDFWAQGISLGLELRY